MNMIMTTIWAILAELAGDGRRSRSLLESNDQISDTTKQVTT